MRRFAFRVASLAAAASVAAAQLASPQDAGRQKPPVTYEKRDAQGRVLSRVTFNPDGTIHHMANAYGRRGARMTINVDLDAIREPVAETRETFDEDGRILEREDMTVNESVSVRTRTQYEYDAAGRQTAKVEIVEQPR